MKRSVTGMLYYHTTGMKRTHISWVCPKGLQNQCTCLAWLQYKRPALERTVAQCSSECQELVKPDLSKALSHVLTQKRILTSHDSQCFYGWDFLPNKTRHRWHTLIPPNFIKLQYQMLIVYLQYVQLSWGRRLEEGRTGGPTCQERSRSDSTAQRSLSSAAE